MDTYQKIKIKLKSLQETPTVFWFALILLNMLLLLPAMVFYPGSSQFFPIPPLNTPRGCYDTLAFFFRRENQDFFRIAVDYYIILTAILLLGQVKWSTLLRRILFSIYLFLLIYSGYDAGAHRSVELPLREKERLQSRIHKQQILAGCSCVFLRHNSDDTLYWDPIRHCAVRYGTDVSD